MRTYTINYSGINYEAITPQGRAANAAYDPLFGSQLVGAGDSTLDALSAKIRSELPGATAQTLTLGSGIVGSYAGDRFTLNDEGDGMFNLVVAGVDLGNIGANDIIDLLLIAKEGLSTL